MNNYLIESIDSLSLQKERETLIQKNSFTGVPMSIYDMEEVPLSSALEDLDTYGLFSDQKVIIIHNIESIKQEDFPDDFHHLFEYLKNPNPNYLLILESHKLNNTLKVVKDLKKNCEYIEVSFDPIQVIQKILKDYKIDSNTVRYLNEICLGDITKIQNECQKLMNYKVNEKVITKEDIDELVIPKLGDPKDLTFAFSRALAERDRKEALLKYRELIEYQIEPLSIIGLLASQLRIIYQVKLLENRHLKDKEIADILGEKSDYRIKKTRELTRLYGEEEILLLMQKLADIDYSIKTNDVDGNSLIEMFILNI